jgi:hypothetical protein
MKTGDNTPDDSSLDASTPRPINEMDGSTDLGDGKKDGKGKMRGLLGLGKKKTDSKTAASPATTSQPPSLPKESSKQLSTTVRSTKSPSQVDSHFNQPSSPSRALSSSPRISSPARSQIFERDVQDDTFPAANSPAIPTHIQTENHIPPVLGDATDAITNEKLHPDSVEIVTHNQHLPASVTVTSAPSGSTPYDQAASEWAEELASFADRAPTPADNASNYGSLDSTDVRRLSFISFADVVQSEHVGQSALAGSRDSIHMAGLTTLPAALNRSPSPIRSPVSSQGPGTSPPTSNPASMKGVEMSPPRKPLGSPMSSPHSGNYTISPSGDLNIETMSQALRRTGSKDFSQVRSPPTSPIEGPGSH